MWQPIETAPKKHQEYIWIFDPDVGQYNAHWRDEHDCFCYTWDQAPCCNPTHWQPLPEPPKTKRTLGDAVNAARGGEAPPKPKQGYA